MHSHKEVNLLITPLAMYHDYNLDDLDFASYLNTLHRTPFRRLQHWAVQAGETVYEVTRRGTKNGHATFRSIPASQWWEDAEDRKANVQMRFMGVTTETKDRLTELATLIWTGVMKQEYMFATTNCQSFAMIFRKLIINNEKISLELRARVRHVPMPFNPFIALGEKVRFVRKTDTATRWLRIHRAKPPSSPQSSSAVIPRRPSPKWLDALKHESKTKEIDSYQDLYTIVRLVNEQLHPKRTTLWQRLRQAFGLQNWD